MAKRINFKPYQPDNQVVLFPQAIADLIVPNHPVFTISAIIDRLDLEPLFAKYGKKKGKDELKDPSKGGQNPYHPRMLLKVLIYGYTSNIYSSRKLEAACRENIHFMWLTGRQTPDHNTINRFRSDRLKDVVKEVFAQVVLMLAEEGRLSLKEVFTDGTKIEANANRYTFIWARSIKTNREKIKGQIKELLDYAGKVAAAEMNDTTPTDFDPIDGETVQKTVDQINEALKDKPEVPKAVKAKLAYLKKTAAQNIDKYNKQEEMLAGRNSCSKTDPDATFMRMKEDHMKNGQLKPGYNVQASTSNQYIVNYTLHPNPTDTLTLPAHIESHKALYGEVPEVLVADAGYGSEQNLAFLEEHQIEAFVKHSNFDKDQQAEAQKAPGRRGKKVEDKKPFSADKLHYDQQADCYICPMGQRMHKVWEGVQRTEGGYERKVSKYQAQNCSLCPLRGVCHKSKGNRQIEVSLEAVRLRAAAVARLKSNRGIELRKKRCYDVEPVFGNWKQNHGFRRFMLRGAEKVAIETGLHSLAHNLRKRTRENQKKAA